MMVTVVASSPRTVNCDINATALNIRHILGKFQYKLTALLT